MARDFVFAGWNPDMSHATYRLDKVLFFGHNIMCDMPFDKIASTRLGSFLAPQKTVVRIPSLQLLRLRALPRRICTRLYVHKVKHETGQDFIQFWHLTALEKTAIVS